MDNAVSIVNGPGWIGICLPKKKVWLNLFMISFGNKLF